MTTKLKGPFLLSCAKEKLLFNPINFEVYSHALVHQKIVNLSSSLRSRLKSHLLLKTDETLCLPGSHSCMDFVFYGTESIRGFKHVLCMTCISTRHNENFLWRRKCLTFDIIHHFINFKNREGNKHGELKSIKTGPWLTTMN